MNKKDKIQQVVNNYSAIEVILSFGSADGGAMFAQWLQREIAQRKGYTELNHVYLDTFVLDHVPGTEYIMKEIRPTAGGLASLNKAWEEHYRYAISVAHTMIFVATKAWFASSYCQHEMSCFVAENQARSQTGLSPLSGIVLTFSESEVTPEFADMILIPAIKRYVVADEKKRLKLTGHYRDFWIVEEATIQKLVNAIS
ncbi:hypothetical protein A6770_28765 [Nostoc minutum NIES-26]|uniref:TIR domain-containing protein n=1 Tax=Nostoc minutum NIES-26 TaxID=1844469 RepID=A0A367QLJ0_9NOSO|nr:hypothetical protein A6770_28765 [Nostoc minutum NIES-26]